MFWFGVDGGGVVVDDVLFVDLIDVNVVVDWFDWCVCLWGCGGVGCGGY